MGCDYLTDKCGYKFQKKQLQFKKLKMMEIDIRNQGWEDLRQVYYYTWL